MSDVMKEQRREEAGMRDAKYANLTTDERIARAEAAPGESKRQLAKLRKLKAKEA